MTNHTGAPMVPIHEVVPNKKNPNKHSKEQIAAIAKNIARFGWRVPITVSKRSGLIVRGHGRFLAAKLLGAEQVPVVIQDYDSAAEEWTDLIADNKLAEMASTDDDLMAAMLAEIDADLQALTGLSEMAVQDFVTQQKTQEDLERFDRLIAPEKKEGQTENKPKASGAKVLVVIEGPPTVLTVKRIQEIKNQLTPLGLSMDVIER